MDRPVTSPRQGELTSGGYFDLQDRYISGEAFVAAQDVAQLRLVAICDGQPLQSIVLSPERVKRAGDDIFSVSFEALLHPRVCDGKTHRISVIAAVQSTNHLLKSRAGDVDAALNQFALGCIDSFSGDLVTGWAIDIHNLNGKVAVALFDGDRELLTADTNLARQDVNQTFGVTGDHGFVLKLPNDLFDDKRHSLSIRCRGVVLRMGMTKCFCDTVLAAPKSASVVKGQLHGRVESCTASLITGWAFDAQRQDVPVRLLVFIDGQLEDSILANAYQARLKEVHSTGICAFRCTLPARLMNGRPRSVSVRFAANGQDLPHGLKTVLFPLIDFFGAHQTHSRNAHTLPPMQAPAFPVAPVAGARSRQCDAHAIRVSMIVLNLDGATLLERLLISLQAHQPRVPYEILIVDHGSSDDSEGIVRGHSQRLPIKWIARDRNYSFAESNNHAAQIALGEFLIFLNNDIEFVQEVTEPMLSHFDDDQVGIVGLRLLEPVVNGTGHTEFVPHHEGIAFQAGMGVGRTQEYGYLPVEIAQMHSGLQGASAVVAVSAALMMCRKRDFAAVGGFCEAYEYGLEDVDLCWSFWNRLNKRVVSDTSIECIHYRSYTRDAKGEDQPARVVQATNDRQGNNRKVFQRRIGRGVRDAVLRSLLDGGMLRRQPLRVTFAVTQATTDTGAGDFYTAMELGLALKNAYGWEVMFVSHVQPQIDGTDVLVAMRHEVALRKVTANNPGLITVAWVRNRVDEWLDAGAVADYDLRFCSSQKAVNFLESAGVGKCHLLPIATNPDRFQPRSDIERDKGTVYFTGSYWGATRDAVALLDGTDVQMAIYGKGWDQHQHYRDAWRGWKSYWDLPEVYASAEIVLDDSHPVTRTWNSVNSRVFDAIASGAVPVTNCVGGAAELFGDRLPTFSNRAELLKHLKRLAGDAEKRKQLSTTLRDIVVSEHTYAHRAATLHDVLAWYVKGRKLKIAIKAAVPDAQQAQRWGDYHFAHSLKRALQGLGYAARVDLLPEWYSGLTSADDIVIVLRGLSAYEPRPDRINLLWVISHPMQVTPIECKGYDHVFAASHEFVGELRRGGVTSVSTLHQCTDLELFRPNKGPCDAKGKLLFVGNSRKQKRESVVTAIQAGLDLEVYGADWGGLIPERHIKGEHIPNHLLGRYYSTAQIVLNDHWPDMRNLGFISNRVFDVAACGGVLVSDYHPALQEVFGSSIAMYKDASELGPLVRALQKNPARRARMSVHCRKVVGAKHTFNSRAVEISSAIQRLYFAVPENTGL